MATKITKKYIEARGGRKTSTARVRVYEGSGDSLVNDKLVGEYFPGKLLLERVMEPILVTGLKGKVHFTAHVSGGGKNAGQLDSVRLGIARALVKMDEDKREVLKKNDLLSRDPRAKERKKYFLLKARKRPQFSKR